MADNEHTWLVFLTAGMALLVLGVLLLEDGAWYVQYPVLAAAVGLAAFGLRAELQSPSA